MATENKKYLDLAGLQHLIEKLNDEKRIVKHTGHTATTAAAVKVGKDADGHVVIGGALAKVAESGSYNDLTNKPTIGNGTLTIKANGTSKGTFTANQSTNTEINITLGDLGVDNVLHFRGVKNSLPSAQETSTSYNDGDVILVNNKEYILSGGEWFELGDEASHALKTITISAGTWLTGGGDLSANRTISHAQHSDGAASAAPVKVGRDAYGHVEIGGALTTAENGAHTHSVSSSIPASTFLTSASGTTTKISVNKSDDTFVKSYPGVTSKLVTTTITGTNGTVTASKATAGDDVEVAKAGDAVVYGTANVGTAVTVATRASSQTTVGNANVGTQISITGVDGSTTASKATAGTAVPVAKVGTAVTVAKRDTTAKTIGNANVGTAKTVATGLKSATAAVSNYNAYTASYDAAEECLSLSAATLTVTPTVTLNTTSITPAEASSSTIYGCSSSDASVTPAVSNGEIIPWSFTDVTVPVAASATVFNPATSSSTKIYGVGGTTSIAPAVAAPSTQTIVPAVANGTITPYTFATVTAAKVADASTIVATGTISTTGTGDSLLTSLGTATTAKALTAATIKSGTTGDVTVVTEVKSGKNSAAVSISGTAAEAGKHNHDVE